ncbi:MAG TPA: response regulator transcription factor [Solirubrobacterales bacterium]|nr:response regulator transcription factor [Solirubrobacterales bacterium]
MRVFVADDHPVYRDGMVRAISERPDFELVGEASNGRDALDAIGETKPDVALIDIRMPGLDGLEVLGAVRRDAESTQVLLLSAHLDSDLAYRAVAAGARGYLSKQAARHEICDGIATVADGGTAFATEVQTGLASELHERERGQQGPVLTSREREVLKLVAAGHSAPEIAEQIHLSPATVKSHLQAIYDKLGVAERAAAVAEGMRRGFLE